jgi:hypothetical protein
LEVARVASEEVEAQLAVVELEQAQAEAMEPDLCLEPVRSSIHHRYRLSCP